MKKKGYSECRECDFEVNMHMKAVEVLDGAMKVEQKEKVVGRT